ncbi:hypothetical protein AGMMS49574_05050 [Bacteroidia bacterium]|nr:hypothetical protein AGMMS49574_05050 [Bacteroidia bacterium]
MEDKKIKFLEMIQGVINRMASNSFLLKGWAVTLLAGIFALAAKDSNFSFFLIAYIPIILFWFLDSYYLQLERKYRVLYNRATEILPEQIDFKLNPPKSNEKEKTCFYQSFFSRTECGFYLPAALLVAFVIIISTYFR